MPKVYVVFEGLSGGFLPDTMEYFRSKRDALRHMAALAQELREDYYVVEGNAQTGYSYRRANQDWMPYQISMEEYPFSSRADADEFIRHNQE